MTLQELQAQLDSDLKIDPSNLMQEAAENILKHAKYFHNLTNHKAKLKMLNLELLALMKQKYNYYAGYGVDIYEYNLGSSSAIKYNLEGDSDVIEKQKGIAMVQLKIDFFEKGCDLLVSRGFAIKNMIDLLKFQNGE